MNKLCKYIEENHYQLSEISDYINTACERMGVKTNIKKQHIHIWKQGSYLPRGNHIYKALAQLLEMSVSEVVKDMTQEYLKLRGVNNVYCEQSRIEGI